MTFSTVALPVVGPTKSRSVDSKESVLSAGDVEGPVSAVKESVFDNEVLAK